jgi:hypothetical protein
MVLAELLYQNDQAVSTFFANQHDGYQLLLGIG